MRKTIKNIHKKKAIYILFILFMVLMGNTVYSQDGGDGVIGGGEEGDCTLTISPSGTKNVSAGWGEFIVSLSYQDPDAICTWFASADAVWVTSITPSFGNGGMNVSVTYKENLTSSPRDAFIDFGSESLQLIQAGSTASCNINISQTATRDVSGSEGSFDVSVSSNLTDCGWNASSSEPWATVLPANGIGNGNVHVSYPANPLTYARPANITIAGKTFQLVQWPICPPYEPPKTLTISEPIHGTECIVNNGVIEARDLVTLNGTFSYNAATDAPLTIKTNETLICSPEYTTQVVVTTRSLNTAYDVGTITGNFNVNRHGAATYQIPVALPAGINGMIPSVGLSYNSNAGNGLLGVGWNLNATSSISRGATSILQEGYVDAADFDSNDRFFLDGNRLILVSGTYGANNAQYRTETDTYSRIISYGGTGNNPDKFVVWTKDGQKIEYGLTAASRESTNNGILLWYIERISDYDGNTINYNYKNDNDGFRIESITYANNAINFLYQERNDKNTTYFSDLSIKRNIILRGINIKSQTENYRKYVFTYYMDNYTKLNEIIEYGTDGKRFNSTVVNWGGIGAGQSYINDINVESEPSIYYLGEFNGDGHNDLFIMPKKDTYTTADQYKIVLSNSTGTGFTLQSTGSIPSNLTKVLCNDFNGDGLTDILFFKEDKVQTTKIKYGESNSSANQTVNRTPTSVRNMRLSSGYSSAYQPVLKLNLGNGGSFSTSAVSLTNFEGQIHAADFNADGICDLLSWDGESEPTQNNYNLYYGSSNGTFSSNGPGFIGTGSPATCIGEFNGDGKMDMMVFLSSGTEIYDFHNGVASQFFSNSGLNKYHYIYLGDFNGDGRSDILSKNGAGNWYINYIKEAGFEQELFPTNYIGSDKYPSDTVGFYIADLNGDAKSDIIMVVVDLAYMLNSNGRGWIPDEENSELFTTVFHIYGSEIVKTTPNNFEKKLRVPEYVHPGDFNGDGVDDPISLFYNEADLYYFVKDNQKNKVTSIANGMGIVHKISYSYLAKDDIYTKDATNTYPLVAYQGPNYVVKSVEKKYGTTTLDNISYEYEAALLDRRERAFLGFRRIIATNSVKASEVANTYNFISPLYISYVSNQTVKYNNILLKTITSSNNLENVSGLNSTNYYRLYNITSTDKDELTNVIVSNSITAYDGYKLPTTVVTSYGTDLTVTKNLTYSHVNTTDYWLIGRMSEKVVIKKHKDDANNNVRKTKMNYNATYPYRIDNIDDDYDQASSSVKKILGSYNSNGLPTTVTMRAKNDAATDRTTTITYDPTGRFITQKDMELGHTVKYTYDNLGYLVSQIDINNKPTTFKYDGFGRLKETKLPDGNTVTNTISWDISSQNGTMYKSYTTASGQSPLTEYYDELGRVVLKEAYEYNNQLVKVETVYDSKGRVISQSLPYTGSASEYTTYTYQNDGRLNYTTLPAGRGTVNYDYTASSAKVKVTNPTGWTEKKLDAAGLVDLVEDDGGEINYEYYSSALPHYINYTDKGSGVNQVELQYNHKGMRTQMIDPDIGTVDNTYNPYAEMLTRTENGNTYTMEYDKRGRMISRMNTTAGSESKEWKYDEGYKGVLDRIMYNGNTAMEYTYDTYRRLTKQKEYIDTKTFETSYQYNSYGQLSKLIYPGGFAVKNIYDTYGHLTSVNRAIDDKQLWYSPQTNDLGQFTSYQYGNGVTVTKTYDSYHMPDLVKAYKSTTQLFEWDFNFTSDGNLQQRKDIKNGNQAETFAYDNLDRLTSYKEGTIAYTAGENGNIDYKPQVGDYEYDHATKKHAVTAITSPELPTTLKGRLMTYTAFNKIQKITEEINSKQYEIDFTYGPDHARKQTKLKEDVNLIKTKYYSGGFFEEIKDEVSGETKRYHYIIGGDGLAAMYISGTDPATGDMYYVHKDFLGSILALSNGSGVVAEQYSFDAWGNRRNPTNWAETDTRTNLLIDRGYTGHEHMTLFTLVNMNGRVYDPLIGRFLSPDPVLQSPENSQNFNRYSYVLNNPFKYTDPTGEKWWHWLLGGALTGGAIPTHYLSKGIGHATTSWIDGFIDGMDGEAFNGSSWREADKRAHTSWKIDKGLFIADEGSDWDKFWQVLSRHTWQQPMTEVGNVYAHFSNNKGRVDVDYFHGATVITDPGMSSAISLGGYITINPRYGGVDYNNTTLLHEYGHFLQQRQWGGLVYISGALLSAGSASNLNWRSTGDHQEIWLEQDANARTWNYFQNKMDSNAQSNFMSSKYYANRKYYDMRFLRNGFFPDLLTLYIIDITWSN